MRLALCTISFRHELVSLQQLATWAKPRGFDAIELWAPHARSLKSSIALDGRGLVAGKLPISMLSDYLPLQAAEGTLREKAEASCRLANLWQTKLLRTFAGNQPSAQISSEDRTYFTRQMRLACEIAASHGLTLLIETHPDTLADTLSSTLQLLEEVDHEALGVNFDFLHVWEGGDDPLEALSALKDKVHYYHLKNVRHRKDLNVFQSGNVYSPAGSRDGMVPLFEGVLDYQLYLDVLLNEIVAYGSLEWFGNDAASVIEADAAQIVASGQPVQARRRAP